jgi:plasmid stabilization system protein ParE
MTKVRALRDAVQVAARRLGRRPLIGRMQTGLLPAPYRFWSLTRFQVVLVYNAASAPPRILRILNTAQDFAPLLASLSEPPRADDPT